MTRRRLIAWAVGLVLLAGACSSAEPGRPGAEGPARTTPSESPGQPGSAGSPGGDTGGGAAGPGAPPSPGDGAGAPEGGGQGGEGAGESPEPGGGGSAGGGEGPAIEDRGRLGAMGRALLSAQVPEAVIEIDTTPGDALTGQARDALRSRLAEHGMKQSVGLGASSTVPAQAVYTTDQLRALMESHRAAYSTSSRVAVYVMVLSGRYEDDGVLGVTFNASSFAVFPEQIGGGLLGLNYANFEEAVVVHELGHLFGLVNLTGKGAFHEDPNPDHKSHSANDQSVMFWAVESSLVENIFEGGPPRTFDADDETEMAAIRGG